MHAPHLACSGGHGLLHEAADVEVVGVANIDPHNANAAALDK